MGLPQGELLIFLIVYDESTFNANDDHLKIWIKDDNIPFRKKTHGKEIMVSDFLTPCGRLRVLKHNSLELVLQYETSEDGPKYQLVDQVLKLAIPVFESLFPGCQALFLFDNAMSHAAYSKDALRVSSMNLLVHPGGGQAHLRASINPSTGET
ncbi:hypothetical protein L873DRAFT_1760223 [Choiromyces venosus 120613-1]|uniref:Tc1-like transposase DDE domain-containing protein n=1 Tax=Choiromyces venosus 120613-1 TaxID=1336337 RepID=A0A3N4JZH2_9PEZI|nr:hypothetical protein L873DRAFT_1760223 [Choiromyces venosus 120613-1]